VIVASHLRHEACPCRSRRLTRSAQTKVVKDPPSLRSLCGWGSLHETGTPRPNRPRSLSVSVS
jgi:hypothetical protein